MKINTNSWHYRFIKFCNYNPEDSGTICEYFWAIVRALIQTVFTASAATIVFIILLSPLWLVVTGELLIVSMIGGALLASGVIIYLLIIGITFYGWIKELFSYHKPTLVGQYLRDRHDKICSLIEFVEK